MQTTHKGGVVPIILLIIVVIFVGAIMFGRSHTEDFTTEITHTVIDTATEKGTALVEEGTQKAVGVVQKTAEDVKDTAINEGKKVIGEAMKDAGEKLTADSTPGLYEEYTQEKIAQNNGAVLDFSAAWCPSCRALDKDIIAHVEEIPSGVAILKVDYDTEKDVVKKYGIRQQHTLVQVDAEGNVVKKWIGSPTLADLIAKMEQ